MGFSEPGAITTTASSGWPKDTIARSTPFFAEWSSSDAYSRAFRVGRHSDNVTGYCSLVSLSFLSEIHRGGRSRRISACLCDAGYKILCDRPLGSF